MFLDIFNDYFSCLFWCCLCCLFEMVGWIFIIWIYVFGNFSIVGDVCFDFFWMNVVNVDVCVFYFNLKGFCKVVYGKFIGVVG